MYLVLEGSCVLRKNVISFGSRLFNDIENANDTDRQLPYKFVDIMNIDVGDIIGTEAILIQVKREPDFPVYSFALHVYINFIFNY